MFSVLEVAPFADEAIGLSTSVSSLWAGVVTNHYRKYDANSPSNQFLFELNGAKENESVFACEEKQHDSQFIFCMNYEVS